MIKAIPDKTRLELVTLLDKAAFFFFAVLIFFLPISGAIIEISFGFIFFLIIIRAFLLGVSLKQISTFLKNKINLSALIFYVCISLSLFASGDLLPKSFTAWYGKWGEAILLFYFAQIFLKKKHVKIILKVFLASGLLLCIDGIFQRITGHDFLRGYELINVLNFRYYGTTASFKHFNIFGAYLLVLFFVTLGFLKEAKKKPIKISFIFYLVLILVNILFTYSRGAWVSFLVANFFILTFFFYENKKKLLYLIFPAVLVLGIIAFPTVRERFMLIFRNEGDSDRFEVWAAAVLMFKDSPLIGRGLGLFMDYLPQYTWATGRYAHNCYLQMLAETGILGLSSFLWLLGVIIWEGFRILRRRFDNIFAGMYFGLSVFLIHAFFDNHFYSLKIYTLFWIFAAFITLFIYSKEEKIQ